MEIHLYNRMLIFLNDLLNSGIENNVKKNKNSMLHLKRNEIYVKTEIK